MGDFLSYTLLPVILNMSLTASAVILFVLLARLALRKAPRVFSYALWLVVLFRLLCPVSISAHISLLGLLDTPVAETTAFTTSVDYIPLDVVHTTHPAVTLPVPGLGEAITQALPQGEEQTAADPLEAPVAIAAWVWLAGLAGMAVYSLLSLVRLRRRLVGAVPLEKNVYLADHIATPFVLGLVRPKIYLPSALPEQEQAYILLHERHHIRRLDHVVKLLAFAALCIHWFNPLAWLFFVLLGKDMEMSCDEAVMRRLDGEGRADYSASLLRLATGHRSIAGAPLAFGEGNTRERINNILRWKRPQRRALWAGAALCLVAAAACAANPAAADPSDNPPATTTPPSSVSSGPAQGTYATAADAAYYLELSVPGQTFQEMDEERKAAILAEYGEYLAGYTFLARESADGQSAYLLGQAESRPGPLYGTYSIQVGDFAGGTVEILYTQEESAAVDEALTAGETPQVGCLIRDSSLFRTADDSLVLIEPKTAARTLSVTFNRYLASPDGPAYIEDALARGIAITNPGTPCLYVYRIDPQFGELAECIALTQEQLAAIEAEELKAITPGFGFAASVHTEEGTTTYTEITGVPQTVLDLAIEKCDYRCADPSYITGAVLGAVLEGSWLEEPRQAREGDLARLREILKNAEQGYVGSCGYGAKVTLTLTGGERLTVFKGTDGCDTVVFGSYGGYFLGDAENTEFWQIFGLDPETKEPLAPVGE